VSAAPLRAGRLDVAGRTIVRSGLRWLCADGEQVRAGQPVAYCSIGLIPAGAAGTVFAEEGGDLQVAFAPTAAGRFRRAVGLSRGGYLDRLNSAAWDPRLLIGHVETAAAEMAEEARLLMVAGRRVGQSAADRSGLLAGWHSRARAWWGGVPSATLVGLGTCEQGSLLRGDSGHFGELFERIAGPVQLIACQDEPLVPCVRTLTEQLRFTEADRTAIRADMAASFLAGPFPPTPDDWLFMSALLDQLIRAPLTETTELIVDGAIHVAAAPQALSLSLTAEVPRAGRHRRLGYTLNCHGFRLASVGRAVSHWLRTNFEPLLRTPDEVRDDYRSFLAALAARTGAKVFVHNIVSSQAYERIQNYAALDSASFAGLGSVRAKALNLMLHDLAREHAALHVVDIDAIAADLGMDAHLPDGVHPSGPLQAEIREEFVRVVAGAGVPGFASR
jgi:hypothetical protein